MRRLLATTMALGLVVTAMNFTGIFAVFTDRATTGATGGDSAALPGAADIEIARALSAVDCPEQDYVDDLIGDLVQWSDAKPGDSLSTHWFCVKNVGAASVDVTVTAFDIASSDIACTGDEATAGDVSCGTGLGELNAVVYIGVQQYDCATGTDIGGTAEVTVTGMSVTPKAVGTTIASGDVVCVELLTYYPPVGAAASLTLAQMAQSDAISWRFAFDAVEAA